MDQEGTDRERLLEELKKKLSGCCVDFSGELECSGAEAAGKKENPVDNSGKSPSAEGMQLKDNASEAEKENISGTQGASDKINGTDDFLENIAMCEENLLESFLETGTIAKKDVAELILERKLFPCFFGSALKMEGVDAFIHGMETYMAVPSYPAEFGARIFKIARDEQGNRLTYMKITGGRLKVKETLTNAGKNGIPGRGDLGGKRQIRSVSIPVQNLKCSKRQRQEPSVQSQVLPKHIRERDLALRRILPCRCWNRY